MNALRTLFPPFVGGRLGLGLLVLRLFVGVGMMYHGWNKIQKPFGWMDRPGKPPSPIPDALQALAAAGEFFGGLGLVLGALTPLAALGVLCTMVGAWRIAHASDPLFSVDSSAKTWESAGFFLFSSLALLLAGPGRFSVDALLFGRRETEVPADRLRAQGIART
jgi:putative oxidoreductase